MFTIYLSALDTQEEKDKFEQIYLDYRQDMYAIAYGILNNVQDAEDAVHQTFLKIANNFGKIKSIPCQKLRSYIVILCRNTSIDFYRKNKCQREHFQPLTEKEIPDSVFEDEDFDSLKAAVKSLPEKYRDTVYLYYWRQLSAKDISKLLRISEQAVYQRVCRAKKMLYMSLKGEDDYDENR